MENGAKFHREVSRRIDGHKPKGGLDTTSRHFLENVLKGYSNLLGHSERVALMAEAVAIKEGKDTKATFFGGLLHDIGKVRFPFCLFDGHDISPSEYEDVKKHPKLGFEMLKEVHLFTALCAGYHHGVYKGGYGISLDDIPKNLGTATVEKMLDIATIISICDFIDASTHRHTHIFYGSGADSHDLFSILEEKYPGHVAIVKTALVQKGKLEL